MSILDHGLYDLWVRTEGLYSKTRFVFENTEKNQKHFTKSELEALSRIASNLVELHKMYCWHFNNTLKEKSEQTRGMRAERFSDIVFLASVNECYKHRLFYLQLIRDKTALIYNAIKRSFLKYLWETIPYSMFKQTRRISTVIRSLMVYSMSSWRNAKNEKIFTVKSY